MISDFTAAGPAKQETRVGTLEMVQESSILWSARHQALRYDWVELAGKQAPTLQMLLAEGALTGSGQFVGVDLDKDIIAECAEVFSAETAAGQCDWSTRNLITLLRDQDALPRTGVLVYDSCECARGKAIQRNLDVLFDFAKRQEEQLGQFLLVLNVSLFRVNRDRHVREYVEAIQRHLPWFDAVGDFHVYQSEGRANPMLLCRIGLGL